MTIIASKQFLVDESQGAVLSGTKVCMHVLKSAQADVRGLRNAITLAEAGCRVSFVDVIGHSVQTSEELIGGVEVKHVSVPEAFFATYFKKWALFWSAFMFLRGLFRLIQTPADVYHALDLPALPACYIAAKLHRKPCIYDAYELPLATHSVTNLNKSRYFLKMLLSPILKKIVPDCAGIITVSPPIVEEFRNYYQCQNVTLIRNIPAYKEVSKSDRIRQYLGLDSRVRIALYQGYLQPDRGLDALIYAAPFLERDIVIVLMGEDKVGTQAQLEALIAREGVTDGVKIVPPVPYSELLSWTASADIGLTVYAPDYSKNVQMMLPNKLFEYLMAGLPVLTSELEAITEVVRTYEVGQIVSSLEPRNIAAAINTMLSDRAALGDMHYNALKAAQNSLCWEQESSKLIHFYRDIQQRAGKTGHVSAGKTQASANVSLEKRGGT